MLFLQAIVIHAAQATSQGKRGILEDGPSLERKGLAFARFMLGVALPDAGVFQPSNLLSAAARADDRTSEPAQFDHELLAVLELREVDDRVSQSFGCAFHESVMRQDSLHKVA